jgi:hypothetical protein
LSALYSNTTGSNNTAIGAFTDCASPTASNQLNIANAIFGTGLSGSVSSPAGNIGIGMAAPTAKLHLPAGTTIANTAPLKMTAGTLLTVLELGAIEFTDDGTTGHLYMTMNVAGVLTRRMIL